MDILEYLSDALAKEIRSKGIISEDVIQKCYFEAKEIYSVNENTEQSKKWCKFILEKLEGIDLKQSQQSLSNAIYASISH
jgi:hypothetical protein